MKSRLDPLYRNLTSYLLGSEKSSSLLITGLLAGGHVLIQGAPGLGKTSLAKVLAQSVQCEFRRVQFTPDILPADILGYSIYDQTRGEFVFHRGPIFSNIVLADEINRSSPRVQSALLEAMNESQVTVDGETYVFEKPFFVVATENHLSSVGTFPLPDSQLDRFMLSFSMETPNVETQVAILDLHSGDAPENGPPCVMSREELLEIVAEVHRVHVGRNVMNYITRLCEAIRTHSEFASGPSPRASISLMRAARAMAYMEDCEAVYPDHVKTLASPVLRHRLALKGGVGRASHRTERIMDEILDQTPVPAEAR